MKQVKALETIIVLALAALVASYWFQLYWLIYLAMGLLIISLVSKKLTTWIAQVWLGFSHYLGLIMNYVLMFLIYHLILIPLALLQRLFKGNQMNKSNSEKSFFQFRDHLYTGKDIENPW